MKGLFFSGDRRVEFRHVPDPIPKPNEVVIEVRASGLCGSDLHRYRAPEKSASEFEKFISGHEPAGIICALGSAIDRRQYRIGDRVMVHHYSACGSCEHCRSGWTQMCQTQEVLVYGHNAHGSHAPYIKVPANTLVPLKDDLTFEAGAAISCGTGTAWGGLMRLENLGGKSLLIMGQGPVGLAGTMLAAAHGSRVIAVDLVEQRLQKSLEHGAWRVIDSSKENLLERIREFTEGKGVDLVLETSGSSQATSAALSAVAPWGRVNLVGLGGRVEFDVLDYLRRQVTITTSWSMSIVDQIKCGDFIAENNLPVDDLYSHKWHLREAAQAYQVFDQQQSGKGIFVW